MNTSSVQKTCMQEAQKALQLDQKYLQEFSSVDPFNPSNLVQGAISLKPDHRYGALFISAVNEVPCHQVIYATPKLHYPFGKDGSFHFPPIRDAHIYEKLDGTNITSFVYTHCGAKFVSYKLRLAPFLRNSKWGAFLDYWQELLERYPTVTEKARTSGKHLSFEMYGSRNTHLIEYSNTLDLALLFGICPVNGTIHPPHTLVSTEENIPTAPLLAVLNSENNPAEKFAILREEMEKKNSKTAEEKIKGTEGAVWFVTSPDGKCTLWKCKPESVEEIHWATGINKVAVMATCWNALESSDKLDYAILEPLLLEEYQQNDIDKFRSHIEQCIAQVNSEQEFKDSVLSTYRRLVSNGELIGLTFPKDKGPILRKLSMHFPKEKMSKVYSALAKETK